MGKFIRTFSALCAAVLTALSAVAAQQRTPNPVKYVFLFIGDGMSIPQRMMTEEFLRLNNREGLLINALPNNAITYTRSANSFITDSAASGTAIACGTKTDNGKIGVNPKGEKLESVAYAAKKAGKKVGIITSVTINHATPAAFYAHNDSRGNYYEIALDMLSSGFDFFGGGGVSKNDDKKSKSYKGDIYTLAQNDGWRVFRNGTLEQLATLKNGDEKLMFFAADKAMPYAIDDDSGVRIAEITKKAIEVLDNPKGFFMMVEGGKIDWMCHANDAATVLREVVDFDKAVRVAYEFAKKHPSETLFVVTGDHETGGLTLGFAGTGYNSYINLLDNQKCSRERFAEMLSDARKQNEKLSLDDIKPLITKWLGLKFEGDPKADRLVVNAAELESLQRSFADTLAKSPKAADKFGRAATMVLDNKSAVAWTSGAHTALPVSTTSFGSQSEIFNGTIDNTDISKLLKEAVK